MLLTGALSQLAKEQSCIWLCNSHTFTLVSPKTGYFGDFRVPNATIES